MFDRKQFSATRPMHVYVYATKKIVFKEQKELNPCV